MMIPLAITSTDAMLHRLVYLCEVGGVVHFWWVVKKDITEPLISALLLALLLGLRVFYWLVNTHKQKSQ
jgi:sulfoxide reductase heme-binding subunit YedZ